MGSLYRQPNGRCCLPLRSLFSLPASEYPGGTFFDDDTSIFENEIEALATNGVTRGCNAERTSFCPKDRVTRGQMAAFLVRALKLTELDPSIDFTDDNDSIFEADIERLATAGITTGCGAGNTFCPNDPVTRGQMAAFLSRALKYEVPVIADRDSTIDGILIDVSDEFVAAGCDIPETWTTCSVALTVPQGKFHVWEYWWLDEWSIRADAQTS